VQCFCSSLGKASSPNEKGLPGKIDIYILIIYICMLILYIYICIYILYKYLIIFIHLDGSQIDMQAQS
jgi:hypothetical protein